MYSLPNIELNDHFDIMFRNIRCDTFTTKDLYVFIMQRDILSVKILLNRGIRGEAHYIEACAIYSGSVDIIDLLIDKGYKFNSLEALDYAKSLVSYSCVDTIYCCGCYLPTIDTLELIEKRVTIRELDNGYLTWLSDRHLDLF